MAEPLDYRRPSPPVKQRGEQWTGIAAVWLGGAAFLFLAIALTGLLGDAARPLVVLSAVVAFVAACIGVIGLVQRDEPRPLNWIGAVLGFVVLFALGAIVFYVSRVAH